MKLIAWLVMAILPLGGCALVMANLTFDKDWKAMIDKEGAACESPEGCLFLHEYVFSGYSDQWLEDQVAQGGGRARRAIMVQNAKAAGKQRYMNHALGDMARGAAVGYAVAVSTGV